MMMIAETSRQPRHPLRRRLGRAVLAAAVLAVAAPGPLLAQVAATTTTTTPAPPPAPGTFVSCNLTRATVSGLIASLKNRPANIKDPAPVIDYIVVYTNSNPNHGQPVPGGHTGPVLCINPDRVTVANTSSDAPISGIDISETDQSLHVQYGSAGSWAPNATLVCAAYGDVDKCKTVTNK